MSIKLYILKDNNAFYHAFTDIDDADYIMNLSDFSDIRDNIKANLYTSTDEYFKENHTEEYNRSERLEKSIKHKLTAEELEYLGY